MFNFEGHTHQRVIVHSGGCWGMGKTLDDAKRNFRKAGGRDRRPLIYVFVSVLPFAPPGREHRPGEADAYISQYGVMCWANCFRVWLH